MRCRDGLSWPGHFGPRPGLEDRTGGVNPPIGTPRRGMAVLEAAQARRDRSDRVAVGPSGSSPNRRRKSMSVFEVNGKVVSPGSSFLIARVRVLSATAMFLAVYTIGLIG